MDPLTFTVHGTPKPQGSKRGLINRHTGKVVVIESAGEALRDWRRAVEFAAQQAMVAAGGWRCGTRPLEVVVEFRLPKPKSADRLYPTVPPDIDKLVRACLDALDKAGVYHDDSQVIRLHAAKRYESARTPAGAAVTVTPLR